MDWKAKGGQLNLIMEQETKKNKKEETKTQMLWPTLIGWYRSKNLEGSPKRTRKTMEEIMVMMTMMIYSFITNSWQNYYTR